MVRDQGRAFSVLNTGFGIQVSGLVKAGFGPEESSNLKRVYSEVIPRTPLAVFCFVPRISTLTC